MYKLLHINSSILGMASLGLNHGIHLSGHEFVAGTEVLWHDLVLDLDRLQIQNCLQSSHNLKDLIEFSRRYVENANF